MMNSIEILSFLLLFLVVAFLGGNTTWLPLNIMATAVAVIGLVALSAYVAEEWLIRPTPLLVKMGMSYAAYLGIGFVVWVIGFCRKERLQN